MNFDTNALPITIVSTDTSLLREVTWTLTAFGYEAVASSDWSDEAPWQRLNRPSVMLLDGRDREAVEKLLASSRPPAYTFRIVLQDGSATADVEQLLAAGADDVIHYPANTCELLTRLRSGVRRLEFERRLAAMSMQHEPSGLLSKRGLLRRLEQLAKAPPGTERTLAVVAVDFLDLIRDQYGRRAVRSLSSALWRCIAKRIASKDPCCVLGDGVVGVLLDDRGVHASMELVTGVAGEFRSCDALVRETRSRPSISAVIAPWEQDVAPQDLVEDNLALLNHVRCYGGSRILNASEVQQEVVRWRQQMEAGIPFQSVAAEDVMEPLPLVLPLNNPDREDGRTHRRQVFVPGRPLPPCVPIVDGDRQLLGVVDPRAAQRPPIDEFCLLADFLEPDPVTVNRDQSLSDVFEEFSSLEASFLVVVDRQRPVGYITREGLASLITDPLDGDTYRREAGDTTTTASLVVPLEPPAEPDDVRNTDFEVVPAR